MTSGFLFLWFFHVGMLTFTLWNLLPLLLQKYKLTWPFSSSKTLSQLITNEPLTFLWVISTFTIYLACFLAGMKRSWLQLPVNPCQMMTMTHLSKDVVWSTGDAVLYQISLLSHFPSSEIVARIDWQEAIGGLDVGIDRDFEFCWKRQVFPEQERIWCWWFCFLWASCVSINVTAWTESYIIWVWVDLIPFFHHILHSWDG